MKLSIEDAVFGEPNHVNADLPLERRLFSEVMLKIFKLEQALDEDETVALHVDGITFELKECSLIQGAGLVLFSGIRLKDGGERHQRDEVFLSVQKLFPLSLSLSVLQREELAKPRRKIGFSIQGQEVSPAESSGR